MLPKFAAENSNDSESKFANRNSINSKYYLQYRGRSGGEY